MTHTLVQKFAKKQLKSDLPDLRSGLIVKVHTKIKEGEKSRIQIFEGMIIRMKGSGSLDTSITVRKISDGISIEKVFNIHSPMIEQIEIKQKFKVRRNNLAYLKELSGKAARLKEIRE